MKKLVIIPTYNERENVSRMISKVMSLDGAFDLLVQFSSVTNQLCIQYCLYGTGCQLHGKGSKSDGQDIINN